MSPDAQMLAIFTGAVLISLIIFMCLYEGEKKKRNKAVSNFNELSQSLIKVGERFFKIACEMAVDDLTTNNKDKMIKRLEAVRAFLSRNSLVMKGDIENEINKKYNELLKEEEEEAQQDRIREQMRDEAKAERERNTEAARLERENRDLQKRIAQEQMKELTAKQAKIIEDLRARLIANEGATKRIKSMAELTKFGKIYVISNVGSFGDRVFKVGMTRRLFYEERIDELGDASVPFPFDIHMIIETHDAPALERALHSDLHQYRLNLVNLRKEFFCVSLDEIDRVVVRHQEVVSCEIIKRIPQATAHQFRESLRLRGEGMMPNVPIHTESPAKLETLNDALFYLYENDKMTGPFPLLKVKAMLEDSQIDYQTLICPSGESNWISLNEFIQKKDKHVSLS